MAELYKELIKYVELNKNPWHMPGHKRQSGQLPAGLPYDIDITEIDGFDFLHHAEGILKEAQENAASFYQSEETYFLVNGSTAGILSAIAACVSEGDTIAVGRNCHKSVYNALLLNRLNVVYLYPEMENELGICGGISPGAVQKVLENQAAIRAIVITSPTYEGITSDIRTIAAIAHSYSVPLIIDEAHGAHFGFHAGFPENSIQAGADIVIHSLHKTLPSLTQTALVHVNGKLADRDVLRQYLEIYQTSSPSYVLMASIDSCIHFLQKNGHEFFEKAAERFVRMREKLGSLKVLRVMGEEVCGNAGIAAIDPSRFMISCRASNLTGMELYDTLLQDYDLQLEMASENYIIGIGSIMDTEEMAEGFIKAILDMDGKLEKSHDLEMRFKPYQNECYKGKMKISDVVKAQFEWSGLKEAEGRISAEFVYQYPPGVPILVPGEIIPDGFRRCIQRWQRSGISIQGMKDKSGEQILTVRLAQTERKKVITMGKIYYIMGKSSSGKDSVFKRLLEKKELGLKTVIPYTTRPIRQGEKNGVEYFFTDEKYVKKLEEEHKIIELRRYDTVCGIWKYFTADDGQIDLQSGNYLIIGTLEGYRKLADYFGKEVLQPIYIETEDGMRLNRALSREMQQKEPKYAEMCRRFLADAEDFSEANIKAAGIEKRFVNENLEECLREIENDVFL